jgi:hypothetical protein
MHPPENIEKRRRGKTDDLGRIRNEKMGPRPRGQVPGFFGEVIR